MSNKKELEKIAKEIKSIKAQLNKTAGVILNYDSWESVGPSAQKKMLQKLGSRASKLLGMLGYKVGSVDILTYYMNHGWGSSDIFWSVSIDFQKLNGQGDNINLYPAGDEDNVFSSVDWGFGSWYEEKKFSGSSVENAFDKYSKWVLATISTELK